MSSRDEIGLIARKRHDKVETESMDTILSLGAARERESEGKHMKNGEQGAGIGWGSPSVMALRILQMMAPDRSV